MPDFSQYVQPLPQITISSPYGNRPSLGDFHPGVDLSAPAGTPITNMAGGTVIGTTSGYGGGFGNSVTINNGDGTTTQYAHMQTPPYTVDSSGNLVPLKAGDPVPQGSVLGAVGSTGKSTGNHLHIQMTQNGQIIDPTQAINRANLPPAPAQTTALNQTNKASGTSNNPQNPAIKNPSTTVVHSAGLGDISRSLDNNASTVSSTDVWTSPVDPHKAYYAAAEIILGDVVLCPLSPGKSPTSPGDQGLSVDNQTQGFSNDLRLIEFQYNSSTRSGNLVIFRLFVKAWSDVVQMMALTSQTTKATMRFGYTNIPNGLVGPIKCMVQGITPTFQDNGWDVVVECYDYDAQINAQAGDKNITYQAESGKITDIVKFIANKNNWRACIEPSMPVAPFTPYTQDHQTDLYFIENVLGPKARSAEARTGVVTSDGGAGYGPYITYLHQADPKDTDQRSILHFHPALPSASNATASTPVRTYIWGGVEDAGTNKYGTVVNLNLTFDPTAFATIGGAWLQATAVDVTKKAIHTVDAKGSDFQDNQIGQNQGPVQMNMSSDQPTRANHHHEHDIEFVKAKTAAKFFTLRQYARPATMTVLGDPYLRGGTVVTTMISRPTNGVLMKYDWYVEQAIHTIGAEGGYVVNMNMSVTLVGPYEENNGSGVPNTPQYNQQTSVTGQTNGMTVGSNNPAQVTDK